MGQWLSLPMIVIGLGMIVWAYHKGSAAPVSTDDRAPARPKP
jgi:prolipoprotein diacylglyceryltransferase